jgi:hypothetical protein
MVVTFLGVVSHRRLEGSNHTVMPGLLGTLQLTWLLLAGVVALTKLQVRPLAQGRGPVTLVTTPFSLYLQLGTTVSQAGDGGAKGTYTTSAKQLRQYYKHSLHVQRE